MEQEDKKLLLQDLCSRLPYGINVNEDIQGDFTLIGLTKERVFTTCEVEGCHNDFPIELIKPYLFPLSSMTAEQLFEVQDILGKDEIKIDDGFLRIVDSDRNTISYLEIFALLEWFYENHFDINNLIPMGLAIDATDKNIY